MLKSPIFPSLNLDKMPENFYHLLKDKFRLVTCFDESI